MVAPGMPMRHEHRPGEGSTPFSSGLPSAPWIVLSFARALVMRTWAGVMIVRTGGVGTVFGALFCPVPTVVGPSPLDDWFA